MRLTWRGGGKSPPQVRGGEGNMWQVMTKEFAKGGQRALFKGLSLNWFKGPLATTVSLNTFELIKKLVEKEMDSAD